MTGDLVSVAEFAAMLGISPRNARMAIRRALAGKAYRGARLVIESRSGSRGRGGVAYFVRRGSIPPAWIVNDPLTGHNPGLLFPDTVPSPAVADATSPRGATVSVASSTDMFAWRSAIVHRIVTATAPRTAERSKLIEDLATVERWPNGRRRGQLVAVQTLRNWVAKYNEEGVLALARRPRADKGSQRVILARNLDNQLAKLGVPDDAQRAFAAEVLRFIRSQWAKGVPSWAAIQHNAVGLIKPKLRELGCTLPAPELNTLSRLPRNLIESRKRFRAVAIYRTDAARSAAIQIPRISRDRSALRPMEWVAGDVHHCDIYFTRADGSLCTPKIISWHDLATNRLFISVFIVEKGRSIRREHVLESFADMCADPNFGVPTRLYIDNGAEYMCADIAADLMRLKYKIDVRDFATAPAGVRRARAYAPQSKLIETIFAILERCFFSQITGFVGGNRMTKKTENQGRPPTSHGNDAARLKRSIATAVEAYHTKPQSRHSHLAGRSPYEAFQSYVDAGWTSITLERGELEVAFSTVHQRAVRAGGTFTYGSRIYRHDALASLAGVGRVIVREPIFGDRERLYLFDDDENFIGLAEPEILFPFADPAGAREQQRQAGVLRRQIAEMESQCDASMVPEDTMRRTVEAYGPAPQAQSSKVISIDPKFGRAAAAAREQLPVVSIDESELLQRRQYAEMEGLANMVRSGTED